MVDLNWIDLLLAAVILLGIFLGWSRGFLLEFLDLASWLASLWVAFRFYPHASRWLAQSTAWAEAWTRPAGFLVIFLICLLVLRLVAGSRIAALSPLAHRHPVNKVLGAVPGMANGLIHAIIIAALTMAVPLPASWQAQARDSELNNRFVGHAEVVEAWLRPVFEEAVAETLNTRTLRPQSAEMVKLPFAVKESWPREELEVQMLALVNKERAEAGMKPLAMDEDLIKVARKHSADMLARGYFSHYSPEGKSAYDRLRADKIRFLLVGENLALAPTVKIAHAGLMNSPGHRANILRPQFRKVGIGIMDAGPRGIMVTQKFSN
jgi:uncharacterized protein YkwD